MGNETLSQEEIRFQNVAVNHYAGWWHDCPYKSIGSIMHWIYVYSNLHIAESIIIGQDSATLFGKPYCTFMFDDSLQMPIFKFENGHEWERLNQEAYLKGLSENWNLPFNIKPKVNDTKPD